MDDEELRAILARVSAGDLSPEEAAALLGGGDGDEAPEPEPEPAPAASDRQAGADFSGVRVVRLRATANRTRVVADPTVRTVKVTGPHRLRVDGDRVVVENELVADEHRSGRAAYVRISGMRNARLQGFNGLQGFRGHETLEVRINPGLELEFDCDAGMIEVLGATRGLTGTVNAGNAVIEDFDGPVRLSVNAGKLRARGRIDRGDSSIDVNVGKADVTLDDGSSVRIVRTATFGTAESDTDVVGHGDGTLRVSCSLGAVRVHSSDGSLSVRHHHVHQET